MPLAALLLQIVVLQALESGPRPLLVAVHLATTRWPLPSSGVLGAPYGAHRFTGSRPPSRKVEVGEDSNAADSWEMIEPVDERELR